MKKQIKIAGREIEIEDLWYSAVRWAAAGGFTLSELNRFPDPDGHDREATLEEVIREKIIVHHAIITTDEFRRMRPRVVWLLFDEIFRITRESMNAALAHTIVTVGKKVVVKGIASDDIASFQEKGFDVRNINLWKLTADHVGIFEKLIVENTIFKNDDLEKTKVCDLWAAYIDLGLTLIKGGKD